MAENNIDDIRQRRLRRPPVSSRRLENVGLDLEVPLQHETDEVLPLCAYETLGVGYGFDRLYAIDLKQESPVPIPLPSRHELTKFARADNPSGLSYKGLKGQFGRRGADTSVTPIVGKAHSDFLNTHDGVLLTQSDVSLYSIQTNATSFSDFARAFIGSGEEGSTKLGLFGVDAANARGNDAGQDGKDLVCLDPLLLKDVMRLVQDKNIVAGVLQGYTNPATRAVVRTVQHLYNTISPSAWETVLFNQKTFAEVPKLLLYLDKAF